MSYPQHMKGFHGHKDKDLYFWPGRYSPVQWTETRETKYFIVQERDVSFRFYSHFHPYVGPLIRKLLRKGTSGLQAADTEYVSDASLPGSLEITVAKGGAVTVPAGSRIALLANVQVTLAGGATVALSSSIEVKTAASGQATLPDGLHATLVKGMWSTPDIDALFTLVQSEEALPLGETKIALSAATGIVLLDGTQATIPAATEVLLTGRPQVTIPAATQVTLVRMARRPVLYADIFAPLRYKPTALVQRPYPIEDLDFTSSGAYSVYNWELFFHVPITIAIHLSKNQRFAEAQRWFHFIFDPTDDSEGPTPERFWKVRPFQSTDVKKVEELLVNLATGADETLRNETIRSIEAWKDAPFRPHVIARYRQQAYMYKTVMAYLDNLIAWGDSLFRQDTGEAIDEAQMLYVLAANILGPRPQPVPKKGSVRPQTYANLRNDLRQFGTIVREVEADLPFDLMPTPAEAADESDRLVTVRSLGKALYFCVPRNDQLLSYWDTVADRLFKIRNSLNIQGIFRQLALFAPPIDPALLARAAAAGLDVSAIVSGLNQPLPLVRFQLLAQKATEIAQEVKGFGNSLLAAMEKEDGEAMVVLRAKHERKIMEMVELVKYSQLQEAIKTTEGLLKSLALAVQRYVYYERLLGKDATEVKNSIPALGELDKPSLEKMKFAMTEPELMPREFEIDIAEALEDEGGKMLSSHEVGEMDRLAEAQEKQASAATLDKIGGALAIIPNFSGNIEPFGMGLSMTFGGSNLSSAMTLWSSFDKTDASKKTYESGKTAKIGSYSRREEDWAFQSALAASEINQIFKQLRAAQLREAIADYELKSHRQQITHAREIETFLNEEGSEKTGKRTNKALYTWMKREVKGLYAQSFQFAFDIARKAERALQHELGQPDLTYLQFGYLAGKEGLLAGERLHLDIKRMEMANYDLKQREYELTKHVSLLQVDPFALLRLRQTGRCTVSLPESLFDMDGPGHYFRRIKTVAVSIPSVTGPYTSVNCTLTLLKSAIRKTPVLGDSYARVDAEDDRFSDYFASLQSIVTSSAQNDSGLFETNLHDERYLPFENSGVISEWQLALPADPSQGDASQFDYQTISDVFLHVRYTAREGGGLLRKGALDNLKSLTESPQPNGTTRLFSVRDEFPTEWAQFQGQQPEANKRFQLKVTLKPEHYPFWSQGRLKSVAGAEILARSTKEPVPGGVDIFDKGDKNDLTVKRESLVKDGSLGNLLAGRLTGSATGIAVPSSPLGELNLFFDDRAFADLWIAITWSST